MTSVVWRQALTDASTVWNDQADELHSAKKCLTEIDTTLLGSRVGPVAKVFVDRWAKRVETLRSNAADHAAALTDSSALWGTSDDASEEAIKKLLPWDQRDLEQGPPSPYYLGNGNGMTP